MDILISGASVAGPSLAHWLHHAGHRVTVVERAPALRGGGYAVDFRGRVHLEVLRRMGLLDAMRARATHMGDIAIVDRDDAVTATMPSAIFSGDLELLRGDLGEILYEATRDHVDYVFGDSVATITQDADGVDVTFERGAPRRFDLVVGADGVNSRVRELVFGPVPQRSLGVYGCIFTMPNEFGLDRAGLMYNEPRLTVTIGGINPDQAVISLFFTAEGLTYDKRDRHDVERQRRIVADAFAGAGWRVPRLLEAMRTAPDFWFDSTAQIRMERWSRGRVVLLGDAGYAGGPGGNGTGLAVVGAHVLAGELATAPFGRAFEVYEHRLRPYVETCQKQASGGADFLVPSTDRKIAQRNRFFRTIRYLPPVKHLFKHLATRTATAFDLPDYGVLGHTRDLSGNRGNVL
ncbi:FAD-dependent monooxygenase [Dactylosporangium aurantiacum]|uniref:FAD-dependent monooxygenase n=1 Tax=Dactylosporangium aurantiacum TaxID=35754 RepID=A0A9Q9I8G1_9ACTN|nr:FAD-dependent monooxygenase [Dactylosporangium aurantiacum]MDG6105167.1 FAD-dependent monooxygenase [Dactylosporangium aurantiacum]UWZ51689.1 FAD-dependent monooxygenase [Dactylosporangium aurantiacum]